MRKFILAIVAVLCLAAVAEATDPVFFQPRVFVQSAPVFVQRQVVVQRQAVVVQAAPVIVRQRAVVVRPLFFGRTVIVR